MTFLLLS